MTKQAEKNYLKNIGQAGRAHAMTKPFNDPHVGNYLAAMGVLFNLLPRPPARLLDLGCGTGWTSTFFARAGYDVTGVDISEDMIEVAQQLRDVEGLTHLNYLSSDYESLAMDGMFDCAVFFDALHHCSDERAALLGVFRALKPGGVLITHEPGVGHSTHPESIHAMKVYGVSERDMPPGLVMAAAREAGFKEFEIYPMPSSVLRLLYLPARRLNHGFWPRALAALHALHTVLRWQAERATRSGVVVMRKPLAPIAQA